MSELPLIKKPKHLSQGSQVAVIAPASPFDRAALMRGIDKLEAWGLKVSYREDIFAKHRFLAGADSRRAAELIEALKDPQIQAIFIARGGYGSMRLLPYLDGLEKLPPKIFVGYSDITVLLNYFYQRWNWVSFHGPVVAKDIGDHLGIQGRDSLLNTLMHTKPLGKLNPPSLRTLFPGVSEGPLVGGCLSMIVATMGTPYQIKTEDKILYLEDVGELLYSIDRMLTQLKLAGIFNRVRGVIFGPLKEAHHDEDYLFTMLEEVLADLKVPALFGFPSGHLVDSWTIPLGLPVTLNATKKFLNFEESALV